MLPIPLLKYIPKVFADKSRSDTVAMCTEADRQLALWLVDIQNLYYLQDVDRCPAKFLDQLGYIVNAGIKNTDSETIKRQKIYTAIQTHKIRGSWEDDAKLRIDAITGLDAVIYRGYEADDWILCGDGVVEVDTMLALLGEGVDADYLGMSLLGEGTEIEIAGNIYINCHDGVTSSTLTAAQIAAIVDEISTDVVPAYMRVYLGYIDTTGAFIVYSGGTIT